MFNNGLILRLARLAGCGVLPLALVLMTACSSGDSVEVENAWVRLLPGNTPMAAYFNISNHSGQPITLTAISSADFAHTHMHQTLHKDGQSSMQMLSQVVVADGAEVAFEPGGRHVMLMKPTHPIKLGDTLTLGFSFSDGKRMDVPFVVRESWQE